MPDKNAAVKRMRALIERGIPFSPTRKQGNALTHAEERAASAWVASVTDAVMAIDPAFGGHYRSKCEKVSAKFAGPPSAGERSSPIRSECVGELVAVLRELLGDIEAGRGASPAGKVRAEAGGGRTPSPARTRARRALA